VVYNCNKVVIYHWIPLDICEVEVLLAEQKHESGEECNDNFDMGSGQSVHLVVEMWRDIPPAKLKVQN